MISSAKNDRGILYVACGMDYATVAAASAVKAASELHLPIHVLTNCDVETLDWPKGTTFKHFEIPTSANRLLRLTAHVETPFERTLMLDADCLVTNPIVAEPLNFLDNWDLCAVVYRPLKQYAYAEHWQRAMQRVGCEAARVIVGGVLYWRNCWQIQELFSRWRSYWEADGRRQDMPALLRAIWDSQVRFWPLVAEDGWLDKRGAYIMHEVGASVPGLPEMTRKLRPPEDPGGEWLWVESATERRRRLKLPARPAVRHAGLKLRKINGRLIAAEIGVWRGDHAEEMLKFLHPKELWLIDPWRAYQTKGAYGEWMRRVRGEAAFRRWSSRDWESVYAKVCKRFKGRSDVRIVRAAGHLAKEPINVHFAYLDGRKDYPGVLADLRCWWARMLPGGVLAGHDWVPEREPELIAAVNEFAAEIGVKPTIKPPDWWFDKEEEGRDERR